MADPSDTCLSEVELSLNDFIDEHTYDNLAPVPQVTGAADRERAKYRFPDPAPRRGGDNDISYDDSRAGGRIVKYSNDRTTAATKDKVVAKLIPDGVSECSIASGRRSVCSSAATVAAIGKEIDAADATSPEEIIEAAKHRLNCTTERCVLKRLETKLGRETVRRELVYMKLTGPTDTKLLSNHDIDQTLQSWRRRFPRFFPYNFNMLNYEEYNFTDGRVRVGPDSLATVSWAEDLSDRFNTAACVINTDVYQGPGKHWMALFADWRDPARATIEFFNSSGNAPAAPWIKWMVRVKTEMELRYAADSSRSETDSADDKKPRHSDDPSGSLHKDGDTAVTGAEYPKIVRVCRIRQQQSRTECGVYSLFYIWSRLNGVPYTYFEETPVPDQLMFEFRQHLFSGEHNNTSGGEVSEDGLAKFDYATYRAQVSIKWE